MLREMQLKNFSKCTIESYLRAITQLSMYYNTPPDQLSVDQIKDYLVFCINEKYVSISFINQTISAIKILFENVLCREWEKIKLPRPRREHKLPVVLSLEEIRRLLDSTINRKHKTILAVAYTGGLRISEVSCLRVRDIDSTRMQIRIEQGKGKKDRDTILSSGALTLLREYWKYYRPVDILFYGNNKNKPITKSTLDKICKENLAKAGINKKASFHTLRHSFATHLLEQGTNIKIIQKLMGHNSLRTTSVYMHLQNFEPGKLVSPLDKQ